MYPKILLFFTILFFCFNLFSDETGDEYPWLRDEKTKQIISRMEQKRRDARSRIFFSGEVHFIFFYHPDSWQGNENDHAFDFGYKNRDFRDDRYHNDGNKGYEVKSPWGSIETGFYGNFMMSTPFIDSDNPLFAGNRMRLQFNWEFNWMQASAGFSYIFMPFPFYYSSLGIKIGTGWDWLWDVKGNPILCGMGLNTKTGFKDKPFFGPVINVCYSNTLQMDLSALPFISKKAKRWSHFIVTASSSFVFQSLLNLKEDEAYHYLSSDNILNGWSYSSSFVAGYLIPVVEDKRKSFQSFRRLATNAFSIFPLLQTTVSFSLTHFNDSKMMDKGWGSDFVSVKLNPLLIFSLPYNFELILFTEFTNATRYSENTIGNIYFKDRVYEDWAMVFATVGIVFGWYF